MKRDIQIKFRVSEKERVKLDKKIKRSKKSQQDYLIERAFAEPYREWKCDKHEVYGIAGTVPYSCCEKV